MTCRKRTCACHSGLTTLLTRKDIPGRRPHRRLAPADVYGPLAHGPTARCGAVRHARFASSQASFRSERHAAFTYTMRPVLAVSIRPSRRLASRRDWRPRRFAVELSHFFWLTARTNRLGYQKAFKSDPSTCEERLSGWQEPEGAFGTGPRTA